jgi:MFS family permease
MFTPNKSRPGLTTAAFVAFASFGSFWGVWGASVPRVQAQTGVTDGQLGIALLFVAAGALPAMVCTGRVLDRLGMRAAALLIGALGVTGAAVALSAVSFVGLCGGLALVGACSGAADVAINALVGRAEATARRPTITRAHGVFSSCVVLASLGAGLAYAVSLPLAVPFLAIAALSAAGGAIMFAALPSGVDLGPTSARATSEAGSRPHLGTRPILLIGILGALAFANENAHQSWSAVFAHDELHASTGLAAVAPAIFAGTVAVTLFRASSIQPSQARKVVLAGAFAASCGATVIAVAPTLIFAAFGLVLAAGGTAVLFPTLLGLVSRNVDESRRGRATSLLTTVSYLGFLLGPVYVGFWAGTMGLRAAMLAVAALAATLFLLAAPLLRMSGLEQRADGKPGTTPP